MVPVFICILIRLVYGFYYHLPANQFFAAYPTKHDGNYSSDSYFKPWTRMAPYFTAVALAMVMIVIDEKVAKNGDKFVLKAWQYWSCMLVAAFIMLSCVVWPYQDVEHMPEDRWGTTAGSFYYALGRPVWGVALALMTFAFKYMDEDTENDGNGQKSMVKAFLSLEVWQPLGKLTYVMYLIHLIVYLWWMADLETPQYYTEWTEFLLVVGIWFVVASCGLVLWFVMEQPMTNMVTMLLKVITGGGKKGGGQPKYEEVKETDHMIPDENSINAAPAPQDL